MTVQGETGLRGWVGRHRIIAFVAITYAIMNIAWWPMRIMYPDMSMEEHFTNPSHLPFVYLAGASPTWGALITAYLADGAEGLRAIGRKFKTGASLGTLLLALALPLLTGIAAAALYATMFGDLGGIVWPAWYLIIPPFALLLFIAGPLCEETGWRGYLQPLLLERQGMISASLIIGTIWTFWHVPFFFTVGGTAAITGLTDLFLYWAFTVVHSAMMIVIVTRAHGSIAVAMAFHWGINAWMGNVVQPLFPRATDAQFATIGNIDLILSFIVAAAMVLWLSRTHEKAL